MSDNHGTVAFPDKSLEQLGADANDIYQRGEVANKRALDLANTCGQYLAEAKRRIDAENPYGRRTEEWEKFIATNCTNIKGRRRAEQLIAIATGQTTVAEVQEKQRAANHAFQDRNREAREIAISNAKVKTKVNKDRLRLETEVRKTVKLLTVAQLEEWIRLAPVDRHLMPVAA